MSPLLNVEAHSISQCNCFNIVITVTWFADVDSECVVSGQVFKHQTKGCSLIHRACPWQNIATAKTALLSYNRIFSLHDVKPAEHTVNGAFWLTIKAGMSVKTIYFSTPTDRIVRT